MGNLLGGATGTHNTFQAAPTATVQQATDQYGNVNTGLAQQQAFVQALQAQNGIGNQNAAFQMAQNTANGVGPNPAQAQLNQNTQANTANQAALMAGQRGAGQNAGLIARQAAMQGAQNQQNAIGQSATLQAQQQLAAQQQMAAIAGQQIQNQAGAQNAYTQGAQNSYGQVSNNIQHQDSINAGVAAGNQKNDQSLFGNVMGSLGSVAQMVPGAVSGLMGAGGLGAIGTSGAAMAGGAADAVGGAAAAAGPAAVLLAADGGMVGSITSTIKDAFAEKPKPTATPAPALDKQKAKDFSNVFKAEGGQIGPRSAVGRHFHGHTMLTHTPKMAEGGKVPAMVSPGEQYLKPDQVKQVVEGKASPMKTGEKIPGKPQVGGAVNSYANDTVPKTLETGGMVIPRAVTESKDAEAKAIAFVKAHYAKGKGLPKK